MESRDSLLYQLYLYLWPFWLFRDATRGTMMERAAAYRHNRDKRVYLPGYAVKWTVLTMLQALLIAAFEATRALGLAMLWVVAGLGTTVSVSIVVLAICLATWGYLSWVE